MQRIWCSKSEIVQASTEALKDIPYASPPGLFLFTYTQTVFCPQVELPRFMTGTLLSGELQRETLSLLYPLVHVIKLCCQASWASFKPSVKPKPKPNNTKNLMLKVMRSSFLTLSSTL